MSEVDLVELLTSVVNLGASDLHLTVDAPPLVRLNGDLTPRDSSMNGNSILPFKLTDLDDFAATRTIAVGRWRRRSVIFLITYPSWPIWDMARPFKEFANSSAA